MLSASLAGWAVMQLVTKDVDGGGWGHEESVIVGRASLRITNNLRVPVKVPV